MKNIIAKFLIIALSGISIPVHAQYEFFSPPGAFAIEVSLSNTDQLRLPMYRNAISSLKVIGDNIIGGTTASEGLSPFIFAASISRQELIDILDINKIVPGQKSVQSGFCKWKDNILIAGTLPLDKGDGHLIRIEIADRGASLMSPNELAFCCVARGQRASLRLSRRTSRYRPFTTLVH